MLNFFERARQARVVESGHGPYGQIASVRRHVFTLDEPEELGGCDVGPDPMEMLAASLAACTAMTLRMYAKRRKLELGRIQIDVLHQWVHPQPGSTQDQFTRVISIDPPPTVEVLDKLRDVADRCPVHKALAGSPVIETRWGHGQAEDRS